MITCDEALELLSAQLDGELTVEEEYELEAHLAQCPACGALKSEFASLHEHMPTEELDVPVWLKDSIMDAVRATKVTPLSTPKRKSQWRRWAPVAAVLAVVFMGAWGLGGLRMDSPLSGGGAQSAAGLSVSSPGDDSALAGADSTQENAGDTEQRKELGAENALTAPAPRSADRLPDTSVNPSSTDAPAVYSVPSAEDSETYLGVLHLPSGQYDLLADYPSREEEDGVYYVLPASEFETVVEAYGDIPTVSNAVVGEYALNSQAATGLVVVSTAEQSSPE